MNASRIEIAVGINTIVINHGYEVYTVSTYIRDELFSLYEGDYIGACQELGKQYKFLKLFEQSY